MGYERVRGPKQLLVVGAQTYAETQVLYSQPDFHRQELLPWYDHHLKGKANGVMDRPKVRFFVQGEEVVREAPDWPPSDATPFEFFLDGEKSGVVRSLNDGSLTEAPPAAGGGETSWSYPDPKWMAGVTTFDKNGVPDHFARVVTYTTAPFAPLRHSTATGSLPARVCCTSMPHPTRRT